MSPTNQSKMAGFKQYKRKFFPSSKPETDYALPPEEFGQKLAEESAKEYKKVIDEFLEQTEELAKNKRGSRRTKEPTRP
jgi:hypothetical protein